MAKLNSLLIGAFLMGLGCSSISLDWDSSPTMLATGSDVRIAFNNAAVGARDESNVLHVAWTDNSELWYGQLDPSTGAWTSSIMSIASGRTVFKPTIATAGTSGSGTNLYLAWVEEDVEDIVRITFSTDSGGSWSIPFGVATARGIAEVGVSLYAYEDDSSDLQGVVSWHDEGVNFSYAATSADAWSQQELNDGIYPARNPALDGRGETVWATWDEDESGTKRLHVLRSLDGGVTWEAEPSTAGWELGPEGNDASIAVVSDDLFFLGYHTLGRSYVGISSDAGGTFQGVASTSATDPMGDGFFPRVAYEGFLAVAWEGCVDCGITEDAEKRPYTALGWPWHFGPPDGMSDYDSYEGATLVTTNIDGDTMDVFWLEHDTSAGIYTLWHRAGEITAE